MIKGALTRENDSDYTLENESVWITVKGFSVYLKKTDEGVIVDIYQKGQECLSESLAGTYAYDSELEEVEND